MKTKGFLQVLVIVMLVLMTLSPNSVSAQSSQVLYVKQGGSTSGLCESWDNACDLQYALTSAVSGQEIWVAAGVYKPGTEDRTATFRIISGVGLYGGFDATETTRDQRDWQTNVTILSGDIDQNDLTDPNGVVTDTINIRGENAYHVVVASGVAETAVLDGFVITAGQANGARPDDYGGGMINLDYSNPTLINVTFSGNMAVYGGGMMNIDYSSPTLTNVTFNSNRASYGGAMNNLKGSPTLTNVTFSSNRAYEGGGMYNTNSNPTLIKVAFSKNSASACGGMLNYYTPHIPTNVTFNSNPTLTNVTFSDNAATLYGGGMCNIQSSPMLTNVAFSGNSVVDDGGGMFNSLSSPTLTDVTFSDNSASQGGGMYNKYSSRPTLTDVTFSGNSATNYGGGMYNNSGSPMLTNATFSGNSAGESGGGMFNVECDPVLTNVIFNGNSSRVGGGMFNHSSSPTLTDVTFSSNSANYEGGGMYNENYSNPTLTNVTFGENSADYYGGGMINFNSSPALINVTFSSNSADYDGGGMYNMASSPALTNVILWGNTAPSGAGIYNYATPPQISYSDIQDCGGSGSWNSACGVDGGGNIEGDPRFVDAANGDLRLHNTSPAINAGSNAALPLGILTDLDGNPRIFNGVVDMGAYEYQGTFNEPPMIVTLTAPLNPVQFGQSMDATVEFSDPNISDTHTITWNWGDGSTTTGSSAFESHLYAQPGVYTITVTVTDVGELSDTDTTTVTVLAWTLKGFYQPVDMNGVYNIVKGGSTVPFKFEIFAGPTELTDTAYVTGFTYIPVACDSNAPVDVIETTVIGGTSLRYTDGQFIYNWKTPKTTGCYRVTLTTIDGSSLVAYFRLK